MLFSIANYFRCPAEFLAEALPPDPTRAPQYSPDPNAWQSVMGPALWNMDGLRSYTPDELVDALRLESYPGCRLTRLEAALKTTYYGCRPMMSVGLRSYVQRLWAARATHRSFPRWPVDTSVETICNSVLSSALQRNGPDRIPFIWFWPDGAEACLTITHDVETTRGRDYCGFVMDLDASFGFSSSFQIVPTERYSVPASFLACIREHGNEVCIQDLNHDGHLFDALPEFRRRAALINAYARDYGAKGFRSAILYRNPRWLEYLDFSFDMSFPNVALFDPQRGGCCTVMPYSIGELTELPLTTVQDYTLLHVLRQRSIDIWNKQIDIILSNHGLMSFLVHPDYLLSPDTLAVYTELLSHLRALRTERSVWVALPSEIDAWWRVRNEMSVVQCGGNWRIIGRGSERARLAFATLGEGGTLTYEIAARSGETAAIQVAQSRRPENRPRAAACKCSASDEALWSLSTPPRTAESGRHSLAP